MQTASKPPSVSDMWQQWWAAGEKELNQLWQPWLDYVDKWGAAARKSTRGHEEDCGCGDPCRCCIPAADIVVHARAGERRVVPFELHNRTHRDKEVSSGIGQWTPCEGAQLEVKAEIEGPDTFTLGPCESRIVRMLIAVPGGMRTNDRKPTFTDVESCASAYADVRFDGCSRPIRVAVVVHPSACDAYEVTCDCGCC